MLRRNVPQNRRTFVLSVDGCNRLTAFVQVLLQIDKRTHVCKGKRKTQKTKAKERSTITSIRLGSQRCGPSFLYNTLIFEHSIDHYI